MSFTMYGADLLLRALFTPELVTLPTEVEVALTLTVPPRNATEAQLNEPIATTSYERQTYALNGTLWAPTGFGALYNTVKITYPQVATTWGMLNGWGLVDPVSGQLLNCGPLLDPIATIPGMIPFLDPATVMLGIDS